MKIKKWFRRKKAKEKAHSPENQPVVPKKELAPAEETNYFSFGEHIPNSAGNLEGNYGYVANYIFPNCDFSVYTNEGKCILQYGTDLSFDHRLRVGLRGYMALDYTNDPSPRFANSVVSLGYHALRYIVYDCVISSLSPFTITFPEKYINIENIEKDNVNSRFVRPLRAKFCSEEQEMLSKVLPVVDKHIQDNEERIIAKTLDIVSKHKSVPPEELNKEFSGVRL